MNVTALPDALQHLIVVLFLADLLLLIFATLIWGFVWVRRRIHWRKFYTVNASARNPALEKVVDEIMAARLPALAGR